MLFRSQVNDNPNQTCSTGLHFCSQNYLGHFSGARVMILKINPRDVVSIPTDYDFSKGRCCRYEVIGEIGNDGEKIDNAFNKPVQSNATNNVAKVEPKKGSTPFYRGYSDGYEGRAFTLGRGGFVVP